MENFTYANELLECNPRIFLYLNSSVNLWLIQISAVLIIFIPLYANIKINLLENFTYANKSLCNRESKKHFRI